MQQDTFDPKALRRRVDEWVAGEGAEKLTLLEKTKEEIRKQVSLACRPDFNTFHLPMTL